MVPAQEPQTKQSWSLTKALTSPRTAYRSKRLTTSPGILLLLAFGIGLASLTAGLHRLVLETQKHGGGGFDDWRIAALLLGFAALLGVFSLALTSAFAWAVGRLFRGHAGPADVATAVAWGSAPSILMLFISLPLLVAAIFSDTPVFATIGTPLHLLAAVASFSTTLVMLSEAHGFSQMRSLLSYGLTVLMLLLTATLVRVFLWQPFNIPSDSMAPTLMVGDYLFVSKYTYGYSRFSFPLGLFAFPGRVMADGPTRGDVAVFVLPRDGRTYYISRVVGLPGDSIQMQSGILHINGKPVDKHPAGSMTVTIPDERPRRVAVFEETLPNGKKHRVLDTEPKGPFDSTKVYDVPAGHYFFMGDNRDNSADSRAAWAFGFVPFENLVGRAEIIFFSATREEPSFSRLFKLIR